MMYESSTEASERLFELSERHRSREPHGDGTRPVFGDQESVAETAGKLGIGVPIETPMYPKLAGAQSFARIAEETLPKMLAPGESQWKSAAARLAERVKGGDGLDTAAALVVG
jgi:hypothetical protein